MELSGPAEVRTRDLLDRERTLYRSATQATDCIVGGHKSSSAAAGRLIKV